MSNARAEWLRFHAHGWTSGVASHCRAAADEIDRLDSLAAAYAALTARLHVHCRVCGTPGRGEDMTPTRAGWVCERAECEATL